MNAIVVVPCYNEAARFPVEAFRRYLREACPVQFIFVNDGSRDRTTEILFALRDEFPAVVSVRDNKVNQGKGEAVRGGVLQALDSGPEAVGFWDADLATPLSAITDLLQPLETHRAIQMVFGSRVKLMGREIERKPSRHYLGRVFATAVSTLLRLPIYDTQCGAKIFRANEETRRIFGEPFSSRWVFDVEILARFIGLRKGDMSSVQHAIYEFPLHAWKDIGGSKLRAKDFGRALVDVGRIHRKYRSGYPAR